MIQVEVYDLNYKPTTIEIAESLIKRIAKCATSDKCKIELFDCTFYVLTPYREVVNQIKNNELCAHVIIM